MRRHKVFIAVAVSAMVLLGAILVAQGQAGGDPFPPPPIVPPNELGALPDVDSQPILPVNREVVDMETDKKPFPPTLPAGKEKNEQEKQIVRVIPSFPNMGELKTKPKTEIAPKKTPGDFPVVKPIETPVLPPALPDFPQKAGKAKPTPADGPPLPEFPIAPEKKSGQDGNPIPVPPLPEFPSAPVKKPASTVAPPPPPAPTPAVPDLPMESLAPVEQKPFKVKATDQNKGGAFVPMGDLAPKPVPMFPKKETEPGKPIPIVESTNDKTPALPEMPPAPTPGGMSDIAPAPVHPMPEQVEPKLPTQEPEPVTPGKPSFRIIMPLSAKRPSRETTTSSHKTVYSAPKVQESQTSNKTPPLLVEKSGPGSVLLGQQFYYEISVQNLGSTWAYGAKVEDELPYGVRFVSAEPDAEQDGKWLRWQTDIPPKSARRFRVQVQPTAAGDWKNAARITVSARHSFVTSIQPTSVILRVNAPATAELNETVEFGIHVTNSSGKDMSNLAVVAELSPGLKHPAGANVEGTIESLKSGESTVVTLKTKAVQHASQSIHVRVKSANGEQAESKARIKIGKSGLMLKMQAPRELDLNSEGDLVVDVVNLRSKAVRNVVVRSQLPAGLQYVAASDQGLYRKGTRTVDWLVPQIEPGQVRRLAMKVRADAPGEYAPIVTAHTESGSETKKRETVNITDVPALSVIVRRHPGTVKKGEKKLYIVEVINKGSADATKVQIRAKLLQGLALWQTSGPTLASYNNGVIIFQPLTTLAPGAKAVYGITLIGREVGQFRLGLQIISDQLTEPSMTETTVDVVSER